MEDTQSKYIILIPKTERYWNYQIDEGKTHSIDSKDVFKYVSPFLDTRYFAPLTDMIDRFRMILIDIDNRRAVELTQKDSKASPRKDLEDVMNTAAKEMARSSDPISDIKKREKNIDERLRRIEDRFFKV